MSRAKTRTPTQYKVLKGISHKKHGRHEPGEVVALAHGWNIEWLLDINAIEKHAPELKEEVTDD